jgi:hypothetical protein
MATVLRNVLAIILGVLIGGLVNGALVQLIPRMIPPPAGVDPSSTESLIAGMHLFEPKHFIAPFIAHALGTLLGAIAAYLIAASYKAYLAYAIGVVFVAGGIVACYLIPAPAWFMAADLLLAYLPMAWAAIWIGRRLQRSPPG